MCVLERMFDIKTKRRETRKTTRRNRMRSFDNWKMKIVFSFFKFCFIVVAFCTNIPKSIKFYSIDNCSWNVEDTLAGNTHTHADVSCASFQYHASHTCNLYIFLSGNCIFYDVQRKCQRLADFMQSPHLLALPLYCVCNCCPIPANKFQKQTRQRNRAISDSDRRLPP